MHLFRTVISASTIAIALGAPAIAQVNLGGMISGTDVDRIQELASAYGPVERRSDDDGVWIRGEMDGTIYTISFLNCDDNNQNCTSVQFRAWWESNGNHTMAAMNQWNRDRRFSAAYLDSRDNATIEFDVNLAGSVTAVNFDDTIQWWEAVLEQFKEMVIDPGFNGVEYTGTPQEPTMPPPPVIPSK